MSMQPCGMNTPVERCMPALLFGVVLILHGALLVLIVPENPGKAALVPALSVEFLVDVEPAAAPDVPAESVPAESVPVTPPVSLEPTEPSPAETSPEEGLPVPEIPETERAGSAFPSVAEAAASDISLPLTSSPQGVPDVTALVLRRLEERKVYPLAARKRGIEGSVFLECTILPDGSVSSLETRGAHPFLLQAAEAAVRSAVPFPIPADFRDSVHIQVVLEYRLEDS